MTKEQLIAKLKKAFEDNEFTSFEDWYDCTYSLSDMCLEAEMSIDLSNYSNDGGDSVTMITYYSNKLEKTIILDWDGYRNVDDIDELIELLVDYELQGKELDRRIIRAKKTE